MEMASPDSRPQAEQHFLFVTSELQGHINPARRLAEFVVAANPSSRVTFSTAVSAHRRMFPSLASPDEEVIDDADGRVLCAPYSNGFDEGFDPKVHDTRTYVVRSRDVGRETLSGLVARLAARGRPVTRMVYTILVPWALDVARAHGMPAALYWIQPATVFAVYYRCFHGHGEALASCASDDSIQLPDLPALKSDALPSIVLAASPEHPMYSALQAYRNLLAGVEEYRPKVLVNTFEALEPDALQAVPEHEVIAVGPAVPDAVSLPSRAELPRLQNEAKEDYMAWLDTKAARSVVYVSFGSFVPMSNRQEAEMERALDAAGRPFLWARRGGERNNEAGGEEEKEQGMVVEWCDQVRVLSHPAVGCFVTHCGWNSALESIACGVPVVAVPQWTDQPTVAWLLTERAGVGVRVQVAGDGDGVGGCGELQRCLETVMGDDHRAAEIRARVDRWRELGREAVAAGGSSERNLRAFAFGE